MEKITHYLAPPVLRDWLKPVCRLTSFRPPGGCEYCHDYSAYSYVVDGPQKTNLRMLAVNGQENMSYEGEAFGKFIASTHNYRTKGIYNSTFGLLYDTLHSIGMKMGVCKDSIHVLRSEILKAYEEIKDMPDPTIFLNAFSQGAEVAWRASRSLPPEVRQCIVYQSWGPSTLIPKGWFRSTTNTVATNDYVSITACGLDPIKGFSRSNADVTWIEGKGFVSHPWESAYSDNIKDRGLAFQRKYLE